MSSAEARLLVVEDEQMILELLAGSLRFAGFEVITAVSGAEALRAVSASRPDLMLLDVMIPDGDGFEVVRRMRASGPDVPVILLTARDDVRDRVAGLAMAGTTTSPSRTAWTRCWSASGRCCGAPAARPRGRGCAWPAWNSTKTAMKSGRRQRPSAGTAHGVPGRSHRRSRPDQHGGESARRRGRAPGVRRAAQRYTNAVQRCSRRRVGKLLARPGAAAVRWPARGYRLQP